METLFIYQALSDVELDWVSGGGDQPPPAPAPQKEEPKKDPPKKEPTQKENELAASLSGKLKENEKPEFRVMFTYTRRF